MDTSRSSRDCWIAEGEHSSDILFDRDMVFFHGIAVPRPAHVKADAFCSVAPLDKVHGELLAFLCSPRHLGDGPGITALNLQAYKDIYIAIVVYGSRVSTACIYNNYCLVSVSVFRAAGSRTARLVC